MLARSLGGGAVEGFERAGLDANKFEGNDVWPLAKHSLVDPKVIVAVLNNGGFRCLNIEPSLVVANALAMRDLGTASIG